MFYIIKKMFLAKAQEIFFANTRKMIFASTQKKFFANTQKMISGAKALKRIRAALSIASTWRTPDRVYMFEYV